VWPALSEQVVGNGVLGAENASRSEMTRMLAPAGTSVVVVMLIVSLNGAPAASSWAAPMAMGEPICARVADAARKLASAVAQARGTARSCRTIVASSRAGSVDRDGISAAERDSRRIPIRRRIVARLSSSGRPRPMRGQRAGARQAAPDVAAEGMDDLSPARPRERAVDTGLGDAVSAVVEVATR
jgi:hypothetical protein